LKKTTVKTPKNLIGAAVRKLRLSQRTPVSQQDLSGRLAARGILIDQSAIARIEKGERYVLDYEAAAIAKAFRVPIERLFARR
jgi:transcriptional regulator with XRE-family HTH domain